MANASSFFPYLLGCGNGLELTGPGERHSLLMCGGLHPALTTLWVELW